MTLTEEQKKQARAYYEAQGISRAGGSAGNGGSTASPKYVGVNTEF